MKKFPKICTKAGMLIAGAVIASSAYATPELQLTFPGGTYVNSTTFAGGQIATLYAFLDPGKKGPSPTNTFYISAALETGAADAPLPDTSVLGGSFVFNGTTVDASSGMTWGVPTGLPTHGDYPTFYSQFSFKFDDGLTTAFDVEPGSGTGSGTPSGPIVGGCTKNCMYFESFTIDTTNLNPAYSINFDLYDLNTDGHVDVSAPFSHDAQSTVGGGGGGGGGGAGECTIDCASVPVPEPGILSLMGLGLLGLAAMRRRLK